jgi:hypothetical protein
MVRPALVPHVYARPAFAVAVPPVRMRVVLPPVDPNLLGAMERLWKEHHGLPTTGEEPAEEPTVGPQSALPPAGWDVPVDLGQWQSVRPLALPCVEMDPAAGRVRFAAGGPSVRLSGGSIHWEGPALLPPSAVAGAVTGWFNLFGGQMSAESDIRPIEYRIEIRD